MINLLLKKEVVRLAIIPDTEVMTRQLLAALIKKHPRVKAFGFSKKHTSEIIKLRHSNGHIEYPHNLYNLPVAWEQEITYLT